jgi:phosphatidylglycerol:prolipoprotein diacylglycerol transferase
MKPILFSIFSWPVHSYGFMLAVAFLIGIIGVGRAARREGISFDAIVDLGIVVLIGAVAGSRIAYVLTEYRYFIQAPWWEVFLINSGGLAFHGGLIGGFLTGLWFVRRRRLPPWRLADLAAPYIALGYATVRIGCLLNGCCYGKPSALPWAFACAAGDFTQRHPTQIYAMIGSLVLFFILWRLRNHRRFQGFLFMLYVGLYSILRFVVEFFREGPMLLPWLSLGQAVCVFLGAGAFGLIAFIEIRQRRKAVDNAGTALSD